MRVVFQNLTRKDHRNPTVLLPAKKVEGRFGCDRTVAFGGMDPSEFGPLLRRQEVRRERSLNQPDEASVHWRSAMLAKLTSSPTVSSAGVSTRP